MGKNNKIDYTKEITIHHHDILLKALRTRESDYLKFLGIIITALVSFGYALEKYLNSPCKQSLILFIAGLLFSLILFLWGIGLSVVFGYNFRQLQAVLYKMAENLEATIENNKELGYMLKSWNPCPKVDKGTIDLPELYRFHHKIFIFFALGVIIISISIFVKFYFYYRYLITFIILLSICFIGFILLNCIYYNRYKKETNKNNTDKKKKYKVTFKNYLFKYFSFNNYWKEKIEKGCNEYKNLKQKK